MISLVMFHMQLGYLVLNPLLTGLKTRIPVHQLPWSKYGMKVANYPRILSSLYIYIFVYIYMYIYIYVCMYVCLYVCMYVCIYIYVYKYIRATVNIWYIAPSHQLLKSVLSFLRFWYISKCYRFLKSVLSFFKRPTSISQK